MVSRKLLKAVPHRLIDLGVASLLQGRSMGLDGGLELT
jgi:hypothetical protein